MAKKKTKPSSARPAFALEQIIPKIKQILKMDLRTEEARQAQAEFIFQTLSAMAADIDQVVKAAGDYPEGVISGDAWMTGAEYAAHSEALTHHFAENGWLKHEANASWLWVQATLAVCSHYHHMVGPAMIASARCFQRTGDVEQAIQMWSGVVSDFAFLLDNYDDEPSGPHADDRVAIESLRHCCQQLQATGRKRVDSLHLAKLVTRANEILARPAPTEDDD